MFVAISFGVFLWAPSYALYTHYNAYLQLFVTKYVDHFTAARRSSQCNKPQLQTMVVVLEIYNCTGDLQHCVGVVAYHIDSKSH